MQKLRTNFNPDSEAGTALASGAGFPPAGFGERLGKKFPPFFGPAGQAGSLPHYLRPLPASEFGFNPNSEMERERARPGRSFPRPREKPRREKFHQFVPASCASAGHARAASNARGGRAPLIRNAGSTLDEPHEPRFRSGDEPRTTRTTRNEKAKTRFPEPKLIHPKSEP